VSDDIERRFIQAVDNYTRALPEYDRGLSAALALAAFRTGRRSATSDDRPATTEHQVTDQ
jgi:hypothetical protein